MKTKKKSNLIIASAIFLTLFGTACKKGTNTATPYQAPPAVTGFKLTVDAKFGNLLTDNNGRSLYFLSNDVGGSSTCSGGCAVTWPVFYQQNPTIGTGLTASDFGEITRSDGTKQNTYKGWPLYYFMNDTKAGDTKGDAVANIWAIAKPDYTVMFGNAQLVGLDSVKYTSQGVAGVEISQYITDANGNTLYLFTKDASSQNKFTKADFTNNKTFPIDTVASVGSIPTILDKTQFTTINVFGKTQLVYKGHPMYFFGQDAAKRGNTKAVSVPTPGAAIWKILNTSTPIL